MVNVKKHKREIKQVGMTPEEYRRFVKEGETRQKELNVEFMQTGRRLKYMYPEISGRPVKLKYGKFVEE